MSKKEEVKNIVLGYIVWLIFSGTGLALCGYSFITAYSGEFTAEMMIDSYDPTESGSMRDRRRRANMHTFLLLFGNKGLMGLSILGVIICLYNIILAIVNWRRFLKRKRLYKASLVPDKCFERWDWKELLRDVKALLFPKAKKALPAPASDEDSPPLPPPDKK